MSKKPILYKVLVVGVIVLFIGIGIQPAFAVTTNTSESNEDCNLCAKKVSKSHLILIQSLLKRLEKYDTQLSFLSKFNLKIKEKYQELSEIITTLKELNNDLKKVSNGDKNINICDLLGNIASEFIYQFIFLYLLTTKWHILSIFYPISIVIYAIGILIWINVVVFCIWLPLIL